MAILQDPQNRLPIGAAVPRVDQRSPLSRRRAAAAPVSSPNRTPPPYAAYFVPPPRPTPRVRACWRGGLAPFFGVSRRAPWPCPRRRRRVVVGGIIALPWGLGVALVRSQPAA